MFWKEEGQAFPTHPFLYKKGSQKVSYSPANISKKNPFSIANSSVQINCPGVPNLSLRITWNRHYRPSHGLTLYLFKVARRSGLIRAIAFRLWPRINILAADFLPIFWNSAQKPKSYVDFKKFQKKLEKKVFFWDFFLLGFWTFWFSSEFFFRDPKKSRKSGKISKIKIICKIFENRHNFRKKIAMIEISKIKSVANYNSKAIAGV